MSSVAVTHSRQLSRRAENLMKRQAPTVLATAPVKPEPFYPPISLSYLEVLAGAVRVEVEPIVVDAPELWPQAEHERRRYVDPTTIHEHGNRGNNRAALRAQLGGTEAMAGPFDFGAEVRVTVALYYPGEMVVRKVVLVGTMNAIRRALPDQATVKAWREAGVTEFPILFEGAGLRWVPIAQAPQVLQMEYASRGLDDRYEL